MPDFSQQMVSDLDALKSTQDFCTEWKTKWRALAVAAQSFLNVLFPAGAKVLQFLITIADGFCAKP